MTFHERFPTMRINFSHDLMLQKFEKALLLGLLVSAGAIASSASPGIAAPQPAQADQSLGLSNRPEPSNALEAEALEMPEELADLREMGRQVGDRLAEIEPVVQQVVRPLGRQALRVFLESAPGLSRRAIDLGEQGLAELEKRAMERLKQAQTDFERGAQVNPNQVNPNL